MLFWDMKNPPSFHTLKVSAVHQHVIDNNVTTSRLLAWCGLVLTSLLVLQGCPVDTINLNEDLSCEGSEGMVSDGRVCQGGVWVIQEGGRLDMDMSLADLPDMVLMPPDGGGCLAESDEQLCMLANRECGPLRGQPDRCNQTRNIDECGPCDTGEVCDAFGACIAECEGQSTAELCRMGGAQCGPLQTQDTCGNMLDLNCGMCTGGNDVCQGGNCVCVPTPAPQLCSEAGAQCGFLTVADGCGNMVTIDCGGCEMNGDFTCSGDNRCECALESDNEFCGRFSAQCGMVQGENNCGEVVTVNCGGCDNNDPCNADKTCPVCQPFDDAALCAQAGLQCGMHSVTNNCGDAVTVDCGGCTNDRECSGAGICECPTPSCNGVACGTVTNACNNSNTCNNTCNATTQQCMGNSCECKPETNVELCSAQGAVCGVITVDDRCGMTRTISCGMCGMGEICTDANVCCTPQTNAQLCNNNGRECGGLTTTDNCGVQRTINSCGSCGPGELCNAGSCECPTPSCNGVACGMVSELLLDPQIVQGVPKNVFFSDQIESFIFVIAI